MKIHTRSRGFTLIELMITVGVLAIVAAIAMPAYSGYISSARKVEGHNNIETLKSAQAEFFAENNTFFVGSSTGDLITNSGGLWLPAEATEAERQFKYTVVLNAAKPTATPPTPMTYTATATGKGNDVPATVVITYDAN